MARNLKDLRREAGFRSGREFADAMGINQATYRRYEQQPEGIPLKQAWAIADRLGCSIDMVVGREPVSVEDMRGDFQKAYDGLPPRYREMMDDYLQFVGAKANEDAMLRGREEDRRFERYAEAYEQVFYQQLDSEGRLVDVMAFSLPETVRSMFEDFVSARARMESDRGISEHLKGLEEELRQGYLNFEGVEGSETRDLAEQEIEEAIQSERESMEEQFARKSQREVEKIMEAYDRRHMERPLPRIAPTRRQ